MESYYIDLRTCSASEYDRIMKLTEYYAWDIYPVANLPKVYEIIWDNKESISELLKIPNELISRYPLHNM